MFLRPFLLHWLQSTGLLRQIKTFYLNFQIYCLFSASNLRESFSWGISTTSDLGLPDHRAVFFNMELPDINTASSRIINYRSLVDPVPSCLFKSCFDSLYPVVLSIINDSLCTGVVPAALKIAAVTPVPKTNNMGFDNLNNFRLISNLPFLSKILEQTVAFQLLSHLSSNDLFEPLQSGFRKLHSTETALVKVTNDLLMASDSGRLSILILLDLSAAFDTIDHSILITRLETVFGVSDSALKWFKSYL